MGSSASSELAASFLAFLLRYWLGIGLYICMRQWVHSSSHVARLPDHSIHFIPPPPTHTYAHALHGVVHTDIDTESLKPLFEVHEKYIYTIHNFAVQVDDYMGIWGEGVRGNNARGKLESCQNRLIINCP